MSSSETKFRGVGRDRSLPTAVNQGESVNARATKYGELMTSQLDLHALADEGTLFTAHNTTNDASTTLAGHAAPVLADADATLVKPFIFLRVPNAATKRLYMKYIEIEVVTAGANGTQACWAAQLDTGTTRYSSGGTALTIVNPNMQSSETSMLEGQTNHLLGGAVVAGAEGASCRVLGFGTIRPSIEIAGDKKIFLFGQTPSHASGTTPTTLGQHIVNLPPVILGATDQLLLALHGQASQSAAGVYKVRMVWAER